MQYNIKNDKLNLAFNTHGAIVEQFSTQDGFDIFQRVVKDNITDNFSMFVMLTMCNRVTNDSYILNNEIIQLEKTSFDQSQYLHGHGFISNWQLIDLNKHKAILSLEHKANNGYYYLARLSYELLDDNFIATLKITHLGQQTRLYGLGFHPYFAIDDKTKLKINATGYFPMNKNNYLSLDYSKQIEQQFDYSQEKLICKDFVNHLYTAFGGLKLRHSNGTVITMSQIGANYLMMYKDEKRNFIALEPQSHELDACNKEALPGLCTLNQGASMQIQMTINVLA